MDSVYQKIRTLPELSERLSKKGRAGKKVVHCHGVFDLLLSLIHI